MAKKKHKKDPASWEIKRNRDPNKHIDSCSKGYDKSDSRFCQVHHVIPVTDMGDATIGKKISKDDLAKIRKCLAKTKWDINAAPNCVGLPLKRAFVDTTANVSWGGWPCHQVDHPAYTGKVADRMYEEVWQNCLDNMENCDDGAKIIAEQLNEESKFWLNEKLSDRPTKAAWKTRHKNPDTWYIPFSMDKDNPSERKPPPDWDNDFSESMLGRLGELFAAI